MANPRYEEGSEFPSTGVFELPGEPAVVINGVPDVSPSDSTPVQDNILDDSQPERNTGYGEWLEGREVQKLFGNQYYHGTVTNFDKESGWYRVEYEDGDFEDLEWHELEDVLLPMDVTVPLKALALKIIGKKEKPFDKENKKSVSHSRGRKKKHSKG